GKCRAFLAVSSQYSLAANVAIGIHNVNSVWVRFCVDAKVEGLSRLSLNEPHFKDHFCSRLHEAPRQFPDEVEAALCSLHVPLNPPLGRTFIVSIECSHPFIESEPHRAPLLAQLHPQRRLASPNGPNH